MRFREVLEDYVIEEWVDFYVEFLALVNDLNQIDNGPKSRKKIRTSNFHWNNAHDLKPKARDENQSNGINVIVSGEPDGSSHHDDSPIAYPLLQEPTPKKNWENQLKEEIQKVESFYLHKRQEIEHFFNYFIASLKNVYEKDAFQGAHFFSELYEKSMVSAEQITLRYGNKKIMAEIYTELLCLESYCIINMLSVNILLKLYARKFHIQASEAEIHEMFQLSKRQFTKLENFTVMKDAMTNYVATHITNGDQQQALDVLRRNNMIKFEELARISFFLGICCSTFFVLILAAWIEFKTNGSNMVLIFFSSFQVYRYVFCSLLAFWYVTITRYVLQMNHLNFNFVLDIRPSNMGNIQQIIKLQIYITFVFLVAVVLDVFFCSDIANAGPIAAPNVIGLLLFLGTIIAVLLPLRSFLLDIKYALAKLILQCLGAPITTVAFIHILVADALTSFNKPILDAINSFCWASQGGWKDVTQNADCGFSKLWTIIILAFPYYLRFMQCLKRYYVTKLAFPNLYNAAKYALSIATIVIGNFSFTNSPSLIIWFYLIGFSSFFYNNYWDNYNDWGLFRSWIGQKRFLRDRLTFSPNFYYTVMIVNFFLRLNWMATLLPKDAVEKLFEDSNLFLLIMEALEITRRFLWAIIRIEHELFSNFEQLRDFWTVPNVYYLKDKRRKRLQAL